MKGLRRSMSRAPKGSASIVRQLLRVNKVITVNGATGVGFGTAVIGDLPAGNILFLGAVSYLKFTKLSASGVQDAFDGDYAIGTAPTADASLTGSEVDLIPSTALGAATAGVSPTVRSTHTASVTGTVYDNTDDSLEINLQLLIDDANINADTQTLTASGVVELAYLVMLDD